MPIKRLSHISLSTRDLGAAERFYADVMGFEIAHEFRNAAGERYGFFLHAGGGTFVEFFQKPNDGVNDGLFRHICFETDDIEAFAARVRSHGIGDITIRRGRTDKILQFTFNGPDGIQIEIHQHDAESVLTPFAKGN